MSTATLSIESGAAAPPVDFRYEVHFRRSSDGKEIPGGEIAPAYFQIGHEQLIFEALRKGLVDASGAHDGIAQLPVFAPGSVEQVTGIRLILHKGDDSLEKQFDLGIFESAAQAGLEQLIKSGLLGDDTKAVFQVFARPQTNYESPAATPGVRVAAASRVKRRPVPLLDGRLSEWLSQAEPAGEVGDDFPLFVLESVLERMLEYCFKPGGKEAAAMVVGHLYQQTAPAPDVWGVGDAVIELRHARHERFSLDLTAETFADMNRQLDVRRSRLGRPHEVPLILCHSHPFLPSLTEGGEANCPKCPLRPTCQLTSSFYSTSDVRFHGSHFGKQPWVTGLVAGWTPREETQLRLFCLEGTRSRERGFYRIRNAPSSELKE